MSWCRWSSDDFKSDVYVYEAIDGVAINVAGNRVIPVRPMPPPLSDGLVVGTDEWVRAWMARSDEVHTILEASERVAIGLGCDGESYYGLTYEEAAVKLTALALLGYYIPNGVTEALLSESEEEEDD